MEPESFDELKAQIEERVKIMPYATGFRAGYWETKCMHTMRRYKLLWDAYQELRAEIQKTHAACCPEEATP